MYAHADCVRVSWRASRLGRGRVRRAGAAPARVGGRRAPARAAAAAGARGAQHTVLGRRG